MSTLDGRLRRYWPLFGLVLRSGDLELRLVTEQEVSELAELAAGGVHPPELMPFDSPWTERPSGELERGMLQWHWRLRAEWEPGDWHLDFGVWVNSELVGVQGIAAERFSVTRSVTTGSWLGQRYQGRGIGKAMRAAVLTFAFDGLAAVEARSAAFFDNRASIAVSRALGYRDDGTEVKARRNERAVQQRFVMTREQWYARDRPTLTISGLEACRSMFGVVDA